LPPSHSNPKRKATELSMLLCGHSLTFRVRV
jgi:hypothetical protein